MIRYYVVHACVCPCVHFQLYSYTCTCTCSYILDPAYKRTYVRTHTESCLQIPKTTLIREYLVAQSHSKKLYTYIHIAVHSLAVLLHAHTPLCAHTSVLCLRTSWKTTVMHICMSICVVAVCHTITAGSQYDDSTCVALQYGA